jgi:hypothetical protein
MRLSCTLLSSANGSLKQKCADHLADEIFAFRLPFKCNLAYSARADGTQTAFVHSRVLLS